MKKQSEYDKLFSLQNQVSERLNSCSSVASSSDEKKLKVTRDLTVSVLRSISSFCRPKLLLFFRMDSDLMKGIYAMIIFLRQLNFRVQQRNVVEQILAVPSNTLFPATLTQRRVSKVSLLVLVFYFVRYYSVSITAAVQRKYEYLRRMWNEEEKNEDWEVMKRETTIKKKYRQRRKRWVTFMHRVYHNLMLQILGFTEV